MLTFTPDPIASGHEGPWVVLVATFHLPGFHLQLPLGVYMSLAHCLSALPRSVQSSIYPWVVLASLVDTSGRAATSSESQSLSPEQEGTPHIF